MNPTVVIVCAPMGSEWTDVVIARQRLQSHGLDAEVVSTAGDVQLYCNLDHHDRIHADRSLGDLDVAHASGVLLAGGLVGPYDLRASPLVNDFVDDTLGRGIPLAAAGHGVWLLLGSEHIRGRRLCAPADLAFDVRRAGVELVENETLHVDGCLSSSQGSVEIDDLCRTLADTVLNRRAN